MSYEALQRHPGKREHIQKSGLTNHSATNQFVGVAPILPSGRQTSANTREGSVEMDVE